MAMTVRARNSVYTLAAGNEDAELTLYGDIYETRPLDLWTGNPQEGNFIVLDEFMRDLENLGSVKSLTIRMNSYGGDAGASNAIHNKLRELARDGTALTCIVDGVAMSGGSLIMCACDNVKVNPSSLVMIHKCLSAICGNFNADELREMAKTQDAWDRAQIAIYQRKTGLSETVLSHMMSDATYMTGREAVEKGFADELVENGEGNPVSASADRSRLYACGRPVRLLPGMKVPDWVPVMVSPAGEAEDNTEPEEPGKGVNPMTKDEFRAQNPDLVAEIEADARASGAVEAARTERERIAAIDEVAGLFSAELVREAKYGDHPCTAEQLAYRAAKAAAKNGQKFLADMKADNAESGAQKVAAAPAMNAEPETPDRKQAEAREQIHRLLHGGDR